jgi:hypothetical protein
MLESETPRLTLIFANPRAGRCPSCEAATQESPARKCRELGAASIESRKGRHPAPSQTSVAEKGNQNDDWNRHTQQQQYD